LKICALPNVEEEEEMNSGDEDNELSSDRNHLKKDGVEKL
jgi:hypothetical protein